MVGTHSMGDQIMFYPSRESCSSLLFSLSLLRRSGSASLQKCLQNSRFESCSHYFFLGLNARASSSLYLRSGRTCPAVLQAVSVAPGLPCFRWRFSEALASATGLSSASASGGFLALLPQPTGPHFLLPFRNSSISGPLIASFLIF